MAELLICFDMQTMSEAAHFCIKNKDCVLYYAKLELSGLFKSGEK